MADAVVHATEPASGALINLRRETDEPSVRQPRAPIASGKRIKILFVVLACVVLLAGGAWFAGSRIESPAEVAARTAPPAPSPILVPIERRILSTDVVTRGTVRYGLPRQITLAPSPLKGKPGLITSVPLKNAQIKEGDVLITASGRPVFVLQGQVPGYRDLVPRLAGEDVIQLKEALRRLGYDPGRDDGTYDQQTSAAVAALYKAKGWEPFGPTAEQLAVVRGLERDWGDAIKAKAAAAAAVNNAAIGVNAARAGAVFATRSAALENAVAAPALRSANGPSATLAIESERARAAHANSAAEAEVAALIAERALIVLDPRQPETARSAIEAKLEVARANRERVRLEGEMAVRNAERDAGLASERIEVGRARQRSAQLDGEKTIAAARDAQSLAALDLKIATERAEQISADLDGARRNLGIQMPIDEFVFVGSLPSRVEEVIAAVGGAAAGPVVTVTDNTLAIDSSLVLETVSLIRPGMPVAIDEAALGIKAMGTVDSVATTPGTNGVDRFHVYMSIKVGMSSVPLEGASVRLTIPTRSTRGEVLAVPSSALSLSTDGTSRIQVRTESGLEYVTVEPGLAAGGYVEITPVKGELNPGQMVVVGYNNPSPREDR